MPLSRLDLGATYRVSVTGETYERALAEPMTGRHLQRLTITRDARPGSRLFGHERERRPAATGP